MVTGGAGFIGSHLCESLVATGAEVICLDNFSRGRTDNLGAVMGRSNFKLVKADLRDAEAVSETFRGVEMIFHLAAKVGVKHYVEEPLEVINVNLQGTHNLLEAARRFDVKRFIFASTSEVYGKNPRLPWRENDDRVLGSTNIDRWVYSTTKALDEHECFGYMRKYGINTTVLRYFNTYGPRQEASEYGGVVSIFTRQALRAQPLTVHGDGSQTRCFTYISDSVEGTILAALRERGVGEILNIGSRRETSIRELAEMIIEAVGPKSGLRIKLVPHEEFYGPHYEDLKRRVPDTSKAEEILGFAPRVSLEDGIRYTVDWYGKHPERLT